MHTPKIDGLKNNVEMEMEIEERTTLQIHQMKRVNCNNTLFFFFEKLDRYILF